MNEISLQYPAWFFLFCLLLGAGYAAVLYYRDKTFKNVGSNNKRLLWGLSFLRFAAVSFIAFLLLAPLLKDRFNEREEPVVVVVQDNSASVGTGFSEEDSAAYAAQMQEFVDELGDQFQVQTYSFGTDFNDNLQFAFQDRSTNLSRVFSEIYNLYTNQNVGAVVLASDGIYNEGSNPVYSQKLNAPVFTVALGDTVPKKDLKLRRVNYNKIAYLGDKFSIEIDISAFNCEGENSTLTVSKIGRGQNQTLVREPFSIPNRDFELQRSVILDAEATGIQHYRVSLNPVEGEVTTENNYQDFFVDVLDARQKILILANSPHPDLTAIKQAVELNRNYEAEIAFAQNYSENLEQYNLVIFHQLPSAAVPSTNFINQINQHNIASLFIVGRQTNLPMLNQVQKVVQVTAQGNFNDATPVVNQDFSLFKIPDNLGTYLSRVPPVAVPFGQFTAGANTSVLLHQKIGAVSTDFPVMIFAQGANRQGVFLGDGLWRWRLYDYLLFNSHDQFNELVNKMVQYLAVKEDKRRFRVTLPTNIFNENEPVVMDAELYNESYELVNTPEVSVTITNEEGRDFQFNFNRTTNAYTLNAGFMPVGSYTFTATTTFIGTRHDYSGEFSVEEVKLEALQTTADHQLLYQLSQETGGELYYPAQLDALLERIRNSDQIKPVLHESETTTAFINLKWPFFLILLLLAVEWFLRKYFGGY